MNDQKLENLLNLALDATDAEREKSLNMNFGYDRQNRIWELIVRYHGDLSGVGERTRLSCYPAAMRSLRQKRARLTGFPRSRKSNTSKSRKDCFFQQHRAEVPPVSIHFRPGHLI